MNNIEITQKALIANQLRHLTRSFKAVVNHNQHPIKVIYSQYKAAEISNNHTIMHLESLLLEITDPDAHAIVTAKIDYLKGLKEEINNRLKL